MLWETSNLDASEGIRFRGLTIPECQELLPTYSGVAGDGEPLLESLLWLLLTSVIPLLNSLPEYMHPMTQFTIGLNAAQTGSKFAKAYSNGVHKSEYYKYALEDILYVIAIIPKIAAVIYRNLY